MIRRALKTDSSSLAILHAETLTTSFLAGLGFKFLNKLYTFLIKNEKVWVYEENNEIKGFISFSENSSGMMKRFIVYCPMAIFYLTLNTITHPSNIIKLLETLKVPFQTKKLNKIILPDSEMLSLAVAPNCQISGIGSQLVFAVDKYSKENYISEYKLFAGVTLESANRFHFKCGCTLVSPIRIHGQELSNLYVKKLNSH